MSGERIDSLERFGEDLLAAAPTGSDRRARIAAVAVSALAVVAALGAFTGPGRAVAEDLGELVGIGEDSSFDHSDDGDFDAAGRSVVVAAGKVPDGPAYEIAAYASEPDADKREFVNDAKVATCMSLDFPAIDRKAVWDTTCFGQGEGQGTLRLNGISDDADGRLGPGGRYTISGSASTEVERLEVTYEAEGERRTAPVALGTVDAEVAAEIGGVATGGLFYAFLRDDGVPPQAPLPPAVVDTVEVKAYGAGGDLLATDDFGDLYEKALERIPLPSTPTP